MPMCRASSLRKASSPCGVLPPYYETHEVSGGLPASLDDLGTQNTAVDGYLRDWPRHFDYVLVLNADAAPVTAPAAHVWSATRATRNFIASRRIVVSNGMHSAERPLG